MSKPNDGPISIRLPNDAHQSLLAYASSEGISLSEAMLQAVYEFLKGKGTTDPVAAKRMQAEVELSKIVLARADKIRDTQWGGDVTLELFDWIEKNHLDTYRRAVGASGDHSYRINPQLAKRFAYAINANYEPDAKGNATKTFLSRNANKLIQSYTRLRKP